MRIFKNIELSDNSVLSKIPLWSASTFLVLLYGYLGFFVVCYHRNIPLHTPTFQTAAAIGVYILFYLLLLLILHPSKGHSKISAAIPIGVIMIYLSTNFVLLSYSFLFYLFLYSNIFRAAISFKPLQNWDPLLENSAGNFLLFITTLIVGVFFSTKMMSIIYISLYLFHELDAVDEKKEIKPYQMFIIIIFIPLHISYYFIADSKYSIAGISQQPVTLISTKSDTANYILIYQDQYDYYLTDSVNSGRTLIKKKSDVSELIIGKPHLISNDGGLYKYLLD